MTRETLKNGQYYQAEYDDANNTRTLKATNTPIVTLVGDANVNLPDLNNSSMNPPPTTGAWLTYTDAAGHDWRILRDSVGRMRALVSPPDAQQVTYTREMEYGGPNDAANARNRLISIKNERGDERTFTYGQYGNLTQRVDEEETTEVFVYGGPYHSQMTRRYLSVGGSIVDDWHYAYYTSDGSNGKIGDLQSISDPQNQATTYTYETSSSDGCIDAVNVTDRIGHVTRYEYNAGGNLAQIIRDPGTPPAQLNLVTDYTHDAMGRRLTKTVHRDATSSTLTTWTWDAMGRLLSTTQEMGSEPDLETQYAYDYHGNLTDITDPRDVVTHYTYDYRNRLDTMTEDYGGLNLVTDWDLDGNGNVSSMSQPGGRTTAYLYNEQDFLTKVTDSEGYVTFFEPDPVGMVHKMRRGIATGDNGPFYTEVYEYDNINRLVTRTVDPTDPCDPGQLNLVTTYEYTPASGCGSCTGPAAPGVARPNKVIDPSGKSTYFQYNPAGRLWRVLQKAGDPNNPYPESDDAWTQYATDLEGNVTSYVQAEGEYVEFEYDAANRRTRARAFFDSGSTDYIEFAYAYDGAGNLKTLVTPDGNTRGMTYDLANRLQTVTDALGAVAAFTYDENGNVATRATGLTGQTWTFEYDKLDRVTAIKDPIVESPQDRYATVQYYDATRSVVATNANGVQERKQFDELNRLVTLTENYNGTGGTANTVTTYGYNGVRQTSITDHDNNTTTYKYDNALRLWGVWYADNTTLDPNDPDVEYGYDAAGNLTDRKDQRGIVTNYAYDGLHHLTGRTYSTGRSESFSFDRAGRLRSAANTDFEAEFDYDDLDRLSEARQYFGSGSPYTVGYEYVVALNNMQRKVIYPEGREVTDTFDRRWRLESVVGDLSGGAPVGAAWTFDTGNRRDAAIMGNGVQSAFAYDLNNRLTSVQHAQDVNLDPFYDVDYGYDAVGNRLWKRDNLASRSDRSETYQYDPRNRLIGFERGVLDPNPPDPQNPQIVTPSTDAEMPNRQDWLSLDRRGNWLSFESQIDDSTGTQTRTLANPGGKMNEYDRIDLQVGGMRSIQRATYDAAGNLVVMELIGDMNCDGQTTFADVNAFTLFMSNPTLWHNTYPDCDSLLGDLNGDGQTTFADINGFAALLQGQVLESRRYEYDEENRLTTMRECYADPNDPPLLAIKYDALGRRVETIDYTDTRTPCGFTYTPVTTRHVYSGLQPITEYVKCSEVTGSEFTLAREFVWGASGTEPVALIDWTADGDKALGVEEALHYSQDALGNVVALTDAGDPEAVPSVPPAVVERYEYDPYGRTYIENGDSTVRRTVSKYGNPFAWTGQRYDAGVKLYGFFARAYSPELGRWLQRDPLGFVDGVNLYEYVRSMPTRLTDPLGLAGSVSLALPPIVIVPGSGDDSPPDGDDGPPDGDGPTAEPCEDGGSEPESEDGDGSGSGSNAHGSGSAGGGSGGGSGGGGSDDSGGPSWIDEQIDKLISKIGGSTDDDGSKKPHKKHTPGRGHRRKSEKQQKDRFSRKHADERKDREQDNIDKWRYWDTLDARKKKLLPEYEPCEPRPPEVPEPITLVDKIYWTWLSQGYMTLKQIQILSEMVNDAAETIQREWERPIIPQPTLPLPFPSIGPDPASQ